MMIPMGAIHIEETRACEGSRESPGSATSDIPSDVPRGIPMIFIHHSCGGQLLAQPGPDVGESCIYESHPNGGNLRTLLTTHGYLVHEASYDSVVGGHTDMFDYLPKFKEQMPRILRTARQDQLLPEGQRNRIVVFKSCFTESEFVGEGEGAGNPQGPGLTVANARATLSALLAELAKYPDTLFVYVTAPPLTPNVPAEPAWKWLAKKLAGRGMSEASYRERGRLARNFNEWVSSPSGWLRGYQGNNVVVYNYYDALTGHGCSNFLHYVNADDIYDSHPARHGNEVAAREFLNTLNTAVRERGILPP